MCKRNINQLSLMHPYVGTWPATQASALTRNRTGDLLVHKTMPNPLGHTGQGITSIFQYYLLMCLLFLVLCGLLESTYGVSFISVSSVSGKHSSNRIHKCVLGELITDYKSQISQSSFNKNFLYTSQCQVGCQARGMESVIRSHRLYSELTHAGILTASCDQCINTSKCQMPRKGVGGKKRKAKCQTLEVRTSGNIGRTQNQDRV